MQRDICVLIVILMAFGCSASMETTKMMAEQEGSQRSSDPLVTANNAPVTPDGERFLVWAEEFDGPELSSDMWFIETGDGSQYNIPGWGNNELQWYTPDNVRIEDGVLLIEARTEQRNGKAYTSGRINTRDRFAFRYGRIEARIRLPGGQGIWPAFWLLPQANVYGTWAASGEIDIMEAVNLAPEPPHEVHGTIHYGGQWPDNLYTGYPHVVSGSATTAFHTYALEWDEREMRWYVDDVLYASQNQWSSKAGAFPAPFDKSFYILLNLAVGGNWPGSPNEDTAFPVTMAVDYVRVYSGAPPE